MTTSSGTGDTHDRDRRALLAVAVLAVVAALVVPVVLVWWAQRSSASFADSEVIGVNSLGAATLDVEVGDLVVELEASNLAPGDTVDGRIEIRNGGSLALRYAVEASTSGGELARWISWDVWVGPTCGGSPPPAGLERRAIAIGRTPVPLVGDPTTGRHAGDRHLGVGRSENLCLRARLPLEAPNEVQGSKAELTVDVIAEHDLDAEG